MQGVDPKNIAKLTNGLAAMVGDDNVTMELVGKVLQLLDAHVRGEGPTVVTADKIIRSTFSRESLNKPHEIKPPWQEGWELPKDENEVLYQKHYQPEETAKDENDSPKPVMSSRTEKPIQSPYHVNEKGMRVTKA